MPVIAPIEDIANEIIKLKATRGKVDNQELMIYCFGSDNWEAVVHNPSNFFCSAVDDFSGRGKTMREALLNLYEKVANAD